MTGRALLLTLCWLWLAILLAYVVWGGIAQTGLYYWVGTLEVDRFGSYEPKLTGLVPGLLLAAPALWFIGRDARWRRSALPDPVAAAARRLRLAAFVMIGLGVLALAGATACYFAAQNVPAGTERAVPFDPAALGHGPPPAWKVRLAGAIDESVQASVSESSRLSSSTTYYTGFRPAGEPDKAEPLRIFVEHRVRDTSGPAVPYLASEERGYLVENGLPPLILYALERQGVRVASPHYLLRTGSGVSRDPYYVGAALGGLFGCLLTGIGTLLLILPKGGPRSGFRPAGG